MGWPWIAGALAATLGLLLLARIRAWPAPLVFAAAAAFGFAAGYARQEWCEHLPATHISRLGDTEHVALRGEVADTPRIFLALEDVAERHAPPSGFFPLDIHEMEIEGHAAPWRGRVRVQFYQRHLSLRAGDQVWVSGRLRALRPPTNPGVYDRAAALKRDGIGAVLIAGAGDPVTLIQPRSPLRLRAVIDAVRAAIRDTLARHTEGGAAALQSALLIGSRENLPQDFTSALQRSGTAHFLAISGCNLVIILTTLWVTLLLLGFRGRLMHSTLLALLFLYTTLTGWQVSVVRAFLMAASILTAGLCWRRSNVINSMSLAALILLAFDPGQLFETGFQLSFAAVIGIVAVSPLFHDFLASDRFTPRPWWVGWTARQLRAALAVSLGAWLATAPIVLATFNLVTPVILIANLLLYPLISLEVVLALATLPLSAPLPAAADLLGAASGGIFQLIWICSEGLTKLPFAYLFAPAMPTSWLVGYYALLAAWVIWTRLRPDRRKPWLSALFAITMTAPPLAGGPPRHAVFGMIDVGRGSSAFLRQPDGHTVVFDCGSLSYRDAGATVVAPVLWSRGIVDVHTLVLSHEDADHVNGARSLIERMRIRRLVVPPRFAARELLEFARARGIAVTIASRDHPCPDLEVLGPPDLLRRGAHWPSNERSLVIRARSEHGSILIPGDIEERGTSALLEDRVDLRADVFVAPHHAKRQAFHRELLDAVRPKVSLASAPTGYADPDVLEALRSSGRLFTTGEHGYIECELTLPEVRVTTYNLRGPVGDRSHDGPERR